MSLAVAGTDPPRHHQFSDLPDLLRAGDLLVANDTRVMACRLRGRRATGGAVELLLLAPGPGAVPALARPARKLRKGEVITLDAGHTATITAEAVEGVVCVALSTDPAALMAAQGSLPLPPYLGRPADDADTERYQTVFAGPLGAAAAPTAGLHFDDRLLQHLRQVGIGWCTITLHVGLGTFLPLRPEDIERGHLHTERFSVPEATARAIAATRADGGRVIAVGTTTVRSLEAAARGGEVAATEGSTDLFIRPPYRFSAIDGMITNFHLPRSSLLMLVSALVGRERLLSAYRQAIHEGYRFYSYGDALLLL